MILSVFKTILKGKYWILSLSLVLFSNCSPFYYYLFQTTEPNEEPSLIQYLTPLLVVSAVNNANASPTGFQVTYPWGSFTDLNNGTIRFQGNAGTFGGQSYSTNEIFFAKCASGQTWVSETNSCSPVIPSSLRYCSLNDDSCNDVGTLQLNGTGTSQAFTNCNSLSLAGRSWRVATKNEMKLTLFCADTPTNISLDNGGTCGTAGFKINTMLFPYDSGKVCRYWTSTAVNTTDAWFINYCTGTAISGQNKTSFEYVRCVSDGP